MGRKRREEPDGTFESLPIFPVMLIQILIFAKNQFIFSLVDLVVLDVILLIPKEIG
jgi:hypothetical protein